MDTYKILKTALNVSNTRSNLISTNIANVNTPNYKSQQIQFETLLKESMSKDTFQLATTNKRHIGGDSYQPTIIENRQTSLKENGNNVDLDVEMVNQSTNSLYYSALTAQMNGRLSMASYVVNH